MYYMDGEYKRLGYWSNYDKKKIQKNPQVKIGEARNIKHGDYLLIPRLKTEMETYKALSNSDENGNATIELMNGNLLKLFGVYLAEGCISQTREAEQGIVFCINTKEIELTNFILKTMKDEYGLIGHIHDDTRNRRTIRYWSVKIGKMFKKMFSSGARNKIMPKEFLLLPKARLQLVIDGIFWGDGNQYKNEWSITTTSENMAWQIFYSMIKIGHVVTIGYQKKKRAYRIRKYGGRTARGWMDDNYFYFRVLSVKEIPYEDDVYDLTIDEDHSYVTTVLGKNTGEGFGLPIIESQAAGIPNVITDYTTSRELIEGHGQLVKVKEFIEGQMNTNRAMVDVEDMANCFDKYYNDRELLKKHGIEARKFTLEHYNWEKVMRMWIELLTFGEIYEGD